MYQMPPSSSAPKSPFIKRFQAGTQKYAAGNRVYNGFSPSPHAGGGLDKSGYAERDAQANATRQNLIRQLSQKGTL
jgi:hypothetical protein